MGYLSVNELRETYLKFFEEKGHKRIPSASLIPKNDPSILLINAGMTPLKSYFTGEETPPSKRLTNSQKCIRTDDIENIGYTDRHVTFFEMLGNFSFGDYFKEEMIPWIWEFCTEVIKLDPERLYPTVYEEDDEAFKIWHEKVGIPEERITRLGKDENFWEHGVGPCGPSTEVLYDRGEEYSCGKPTCAPGCDCDRYMEFWNSVFSQYYREEDGTYSELKQKNIDTGVGLERLATIAQDVDSVFAIDTIKNILDKASSICKVKFGEDERSDISLKIITDHIRSAVMMIADGITPGNSGRGYVLRNLIRRAIREATLLNREENFTKELAKVVILQSEDAFPELKENEDFILYTLEAEENTFRKTLDSGSKILYEYIEAAKDNKDEYLDAEKVFLLHDTYGFPFDLTKEIAQEEHLKVDADKYNELMAEQKRRAQADTKKNVQSAWSGDSFPAEVHALDATKFLGHETLEAKGKILYILKANDEGSKFEIVDTAKKGDEIVFITDQTPFYGTGGGQIGDIGKAYKDDGTELKVTMTNKNRQKVYFHQAKVLEGSIKTGEELNLAVDAENRRNTARNHSATHLLHKALRKCIGPHVTQAGSEFNGEYLRFDFHHQGALSKEQLREVEAEVNKAILADLPVKTEVMTVEEAKKAGAVALFDERYDEKMRVVTIGDDYSKEICGGTHVEHSSQIGSFRILNESSVASGIRRIEATSGVNTLKAMDKDRKVLEELNDLLSTSESEVVGRVENLIEQNKDLMKQIEALEAEKVKAQNQDLDTEAKEVNGIKVLATLVDTEDAAQMRDLADELIVDLEPAVIILARAEKGKVNLLIKASDAAINQGINAGKIIKQAAKEVGGGGGGKADMAQAGGRKDENVNKALETAKAEVISILEEEK